MIDFIYLKNVSKKYGECKVLDAVNYKFEYGKTYIILGSSGSGKTTLLRILMGLETIDSGELSGLQDMKKAAVFQEDRLCEQLSAGANIRMVCTKEKALAIHDIEKAMAMVGLFGLSKKTVNELSGGMKRRVSILRALFAESDVIFFDEACKGLDVKTKKDTIQYIVSSTKNKTVFWITHDESELQYFDSFEIVRIQK